MDVHIIVFTTGDIVFWAVLAVIIIGAVAITAWAAGHDAGVRAHREFVKRRDEADMADTAAEFGPVRTPLDGMDLDEWDVDRPRYHRSRHGAGGDL